jgi:hypothetical protein
MRHTHCQALVMRSANAHHLADIAQSEGMTDAAAGN